MKKQIRTLFILVCTLAYTMAQATPRLTVIVAVDGMQQEELSAMRTFWPQGGLRTLQEEAFQAELSFPHLVFGGAESVATLMTGVSPQEHGISADGYFSRSDRKTHAIFADADFKGIGTKQTFSPNDLLATTLSDRFRRMSGEKSMIYAVGLDPYTTLCMAGHSANACCWMDAKENRWATTSYYTEGLPAAADKMNTSDRFNEAESKVWTPRMDVLQYMHPTPQEKKKSFSYTGLQKGHSPIANELIIELALAIQKDRKMGEDPLPDLLLLQLTTLSPKAQSDHIESAEQEEMYLSVNQNIGFLMEQLDKRIGKENYQILVVGLPRLGSSQAQLQLSGLPRKAFNLDRAIALASTYLMALYGHERWIDGGYGHAIYLNRTLIEQKKLPLETIRKQVSNFMLEFSGVQGACSASELSLMQGNAEAVRLRESMQKRTMGDVVFWLEENWVVMNADDQPVDYVVDRNPLVPLLFWSGTLRNYPDRKAVHITTIQDLLFDY